MITHCVYFIWEVAIIFKVLIPVIGNLVTVKQCAFINFLLLLLGLVSLCL